MYDENQIVQVRWNNCNKEWYESKGYTFTKFRDYFDVMVKDLMEHSSVQINVTCDYCNNNFTTQYVLITKGRKIYNKDACCCCASKKANDVSRDKRARKYIGLARKICEDKGYILLTTEKEYTDIKMFVNFICPVHGIQTIGLEVLIRGSGCLPCAIEYRAKELALIPDEVKEYIESINGNILLNKHEYINNATPNLNILCSCGEVFTTSYANYKNGKQKCNSCSSKESKGEERIRNFLDANNIKFEQEKRFDDCRDSKPLPFDFYLPENNLIIEFDGKHHYEETGRGNHEITKKHDEIKNQYCQSHNIDLLRIPYWEGNNINKIISNKLNL